MLKTHTCDQLRLGDVGQRVSLAGWVHRRRDHGHLVFIDLRDRWGITQVVLNAAASESVRLLTAQLRNEYVVRVQGTVCARPAGMANPKMNTGEIEVLAEQIEILNEAKTDAFALVEQDPFLNKPDHTLLREVLLHRWQERLDLAKTG